MIRSLLLLCGLLVVGFAAEVAMVDLSPPSQTQVSRGSTTASSGAVNGARSITRPAGNATHPQWLTEVLARPLFTADRRPAAGAMVRDPGLPRLAGIIGSPEGMVAIFQPEGEARRVLARSGERVAGWRISAIEPEAVIIERTGERLVLSPRFPPATASGPLPSRATGVFRP